ERRLVGAVPDALLDLARARRAVEPQHLGAPGARLEQAEEDLHGGGLAGAVGAEQAHDLAGPDREAEPGQGLGLAEALDQPLDHHHRSVLARLAHGASLLLLGCEIAWRNLAAPCFDKRRAWPSRRASTSVSAAG